MSLWINSSLRSALVRAAMFACALAALAQSAAAGQQRNVIVFIADGLRNGSVNATDALAQAAGSQFHQ
jgi:alkaline phosphatase